MMRSSSVLRPLLLFLICAMAFMLSPSRDVAAGGVEGNNESTGNVRPAVSDDGRYVAFDSLASNLVNGDSNGRSDVFVRDLETGDTVRVSVDSAGSQANGWSGKPAMSSDGRYVSFASVATNLVPGGTNDFGHIFVRDMQTGETALIDVDGDGIQANGPGFSMLDGPAISGDGRYVVFFSYASNLVPDDTNAAPDIFVRDRDTLETTRVSVATGGAQANGGSEQPSVSADGRYVAFVSSASNLVAADSNGAKDVFVHDRVTGETTRVSVDSAGIEGNQESWTPSISADGRHVAFRSSASNLVPGDTNGTYDIFVHDRATGETTRVSVSSAGEEANGSSSLLPAISADGRFVTFTSAASNLVPGDTNNAHDVFVHDRETGEMQRVSEDSAGAQGNGDSTYGVSGPNISGDGRHVAFSSEASNLVAGDSNNHSDVFLRDRETNETVRVSVGGVGGEGPDLVVEDMYSAQTFQNYCHTPSGLIVLIKNVGTLPAGSSITKVWGGPAGEVYLDTPPIAPNESTAVGYEYGFGGNLTAAADWTNVVYEVNENNNSLTQFVQIMTLPTCTAVPPQTATSTPIGTPDPPVGGMAQAPGEPDGIGTGDGWSTLALLVGIAGVALLAAFGWWYARKRFRSQRR